MKTYRLAAGCFYIFVFLKQFYLFPSGSIGPADIFLVLSGIMAFFGRMCQDKRKVLYREDFLWYAFLAFVLLINGAYYILHGNREFLLYSLYWLYCALALWTFRTLMSERFLSSVCAVCKLNLLLQAVILLSGRGRYFYETWGGARFMGTFNDPNQFAFFIFTMFLFLFLYYCNHREKRSFLFFFAVAAFLIYCSKSTGVFIGMAVFLLVLLWNWFWKTYRDSGKRIVWNVLLLMTAAGMVVLLYSLWPSPDFDIARTDYSLLSRVQQKIWKLSNGNLADLLYDRSAERLVLWPKYLLYGAGEGNFARFLPGEEFIKIITPGVFDVVHINEIHSSFFDVWFSYGFIPTLFLLCWIVKNVRAADRWQMAAILGILAESFTLMNCRQPFFWFILIYTSANRVMSTSTGNALCRRWEKPHSSCD